MKQSKLKLVVLLITVLYFSISNVFAQEQLNKTLVDNTITKLGNLMLDYYIIKDKGVAANKMLKSNLKNKKYYSLNGGELANVLIQDLQVVTNDKHIMMKFYPEGDAALSYLEEEAKENEDYEPSELSLKRSRFKNYGFKEVSILDMNIGYLKLDGFYDIRNPETAKAVTTAMSFLSHSNGIIIDLSENTGGDPATLQLLLSYFFKVEPATHYNTFHFRDGKDNYLEKRTLPYVPGKRLSKTPIYVITSENTFSAGEALAYALKHLDRATVIGQATRGGAHAADFRLINDYFDMSIPMARAINPITKTNWEGVGVKPNIKVELEEAKNYAHIELMKTAMKQETDEMLLGRYKWVLEEMEFNLNKFPYSKIELKKYVGNFNGDRKVFIENGKLKYQKGKGEISTLIPFNETSFKFDAFTSTRASFDFDGDILMGLKLYIENGQFLLVKKLE